MNESHTTEPVYVAPDLYKLAYETVKLELTSLLDYIDEVEKTITSKQEHLESEYKVAKEKYGDGEHLEAMFQDDAYQFHHLFPSFTYNGCLVMLCSFLESKLKFVCEWHHRYRLTNIPPSKLAGKDIEKYRTYLQFVAGISLQAVDAEWSRAMTLQNIRHRIIHHSATLDPDNTDKSLLVALSKDPRISFNATDGSFFIKDPALLREAAEGLLRLFKHVSDSLNRANVIARNTSMPYNNDQWGREKSESLIKNVLHALELWTMHAQRTDVHRDGDLEHNTKGTYSSMLWNLTKLYAFFCDAEWNTADRDLLMERGSAGLTDLNLRYRSGSIQPSQQEANDRDSESTQW